MNNYNFSNQDDVYLEELYLKLLRFQELETYHYLNLCKVKLWHCNLIDFLYSNFLETKKLMSNYFLGISITDVGLVHEGAV